MKSSNTLTYRSCNCTTCRHASSAARSARKDARNRAERRLGALLARAEARGDEVRVRKHLQSSARL